MSMTAERKQTLIKEYATQDGRHRLARSAGGDALTERINNLTEHFKTHEKDNPFAPRPAQDGRPAPPACSTI